MLDEEKKKVDNTNITRHKNSVLFQKDPVSALFKHTEKHKHVIYCIAMTFFNRSKCKYFPNSF